VNKPTITKKPRHIVLKADPGNFTPAFGKKITNPVCSFLGLTKDRQAQLEIVDPELVKKIADVINAHNSVEKN
jgi:hypothetical protein